MTSEEASRCLDPVASPVIGSCETLLVDCHRSAKLGLATAARSAEVVEEAATAAAERARRADLANVIMVRLVAAGDQEGKTGVGMRRAWKGFKNTSSHS